MLNCKLSGRTKSGSALTVGIVQAQRSGKVAPSGGSKIISDDFTGDKTMINEMFLLHRSKNTFHSTAARQ